MTPKEKAKDLCNKFLRTYKVSLYPPFNSASQEAKQCALIAADELKEEIENNYDTLHAIDRILFYEQVKKEIENL